MKIVKNVLTDNLLKKTTQEILALQKEKVWVTNIQKWQHRIAPFWKKIGGGCNLNRDIEALILSGGFKFKDLNKKYIKGPKIASYLYYGEAPKV